MFSVLLKTLIWSYTLTSVLWRNGICSQGPHNRPLFAIPRMRPGRRAQLQGSGITWLWGCADSRPVLPTEASWENTELQEQWISCQGCVSGQLCLFGVNSPGTEFGKSDTTDYNIVNQVLFEDPDLELHAGFGSLWEWDPFSGFHDWLLFDMPRVWKPKISGLWRQADQGSVSRPETHVSSGRLENLSLWARRPKVFAIFRHRA
ncbi:uncharacterized protein LOC134343865 isoform X2 [Mobula hypostoma]|uniref:uncharacterized protein LOC134343865 isoform X2 n=1 Tax=Mobula hypostoma TaxID=723540 RepID=UPI002FC2B70F